ncbi:FG-GAP-like repeat-containing protein [Granulicella tundricola]|nr:FG-GAP-like repeat-containing protein [Granulicella tundricola]
MGLSLCAAGSAAGQTQQFVQPTVIGTGSWPVSLVSGDIEDTGRDNLAYCDAVVPGVTPACHLLRGNSDGTYTKHADYPVPYMTGSRALVGSSIAGGKTTHSLVLVSTVSSPSTTLGQLQVSLYPEGSSLGTTPLIITQVMQMPILGGATMRGPSGVNTGGQEDVAFTDSANGYLYTCHLSGLFSYQRFPLPNGAGNVQAADLNGDGVNDLMVAGADGISLYVLMSDATGQLKAPALLQPPHGARSFLLKDLNGDGRIDLVVEGTNGEIDIYPGAGDGTFGTTSIIGSGASDGTTGHGGHLIAAANVDGDGVLDLLTVTPAGLSVLKGQPGLSYTLDGIYNIGPGHASFAVQDFGSGYVNLLVDSPEGIAVVYGNSSGTFGTSSSFATGQPAMSGATGVFMASGNVDAVVAVNSTQAQLLRGAGDGTFTLAASPTTTLKPGAGSWGSVVVGDFNNDGVLDLTVTADGPSTSPVGLGIGVAVQFGQGDGTFKTASAVASHANGGTAPYFGTSFAAPRLGSGGVPGFVNLDAGNLWTLSTPSLANSVPFATLIAPVSDAHAHSLVTAGVLRAGMAADVVAQDEGSLKVYLNSGTGIASTPLGDLAVDGSLTTTGQMVAPDISGTFPGMSKALGFRAFPGSAVIADLDGDGNGDLIVVYDNLDADHRNPTAANPNYVYVWFGSGGGRFLTSAEHPVNPVRLTPTRNYYQVAVADLNGDGHADLILSDGYLISVQYGKGDGTFGAEQHFLAGQGLNTISVADLRHLGRADLVVANGGSVYGNVVANKETLTPNADVNTGGITVLLNQIQPQVQAISGSVTAAPEPANFEAAYSVTATLVVPAGGPAPTGTVTFTSDNDSVNGAAPVTLALGSAAVTNGAATVSIPAYVATTSTIGPMLPGTRALTAVYSGDANYASATLTGTHVVKLGQTTVSLDLTTPLQVYYGQPIDGIVEITPQDPSYNASGSYSVLSNGVLVPGCVDLKGVSCPYGNPDLLDAGNYTLTIAYNGGPANGDPVNGSGLSGPYPFVVLKDLTTGTLTSSLNPATVGTAVTFSAAIVGNVAVPTGNVTFYDGAVAIGTGALNAGVATLTTSSLAVGLHTVTAAYPGTNDFNPVTIGAVAELIVAAVVPPPPPAGPQSFTLTVTPVPVTVGTGRTAVLLVTVTAVNGFAQPVQLSCAGMPFEAACLFIQGTIPVGGGSTTLDVTTMAPHNCGDPGRLGSLGRTGGPLVASLFGGLGLLLLPKRRKRWMRALILVAMLSGVAALGGCGGNCTDLGTRPGNYSFTVSGVAQGGPITQTASQTVKMAVFAD